MRGAVVSVLALSCFGPETELLSIPCYFGYSQKTPRADLEGFQGVLGILRLAHAHDNLRGRTRSRSRLLERKLRTRTAMQSPRTPESILVWKPS